MADIEPEPSNSRVLAFLGRKLQALARRNFDALFVLITLLAVGLILGFIDHKLSFLNFFFIPTLLAGYFMNTRSAVLGGLMAIAWVTFIVVLHPGDFYHPFNRMSLYLDLLSWGSFLIITGALVGKMTEELRARFLKARATLSQLNELQEELAQSNKRLGEKNLDLELTKARMEALLHSTMDPAVAQLILDRKLHSENRTLTVLFSDLKRVEAATPEVQIEELNRIFSMLEPLLLRYRGHLDKYLGNGFMAEFGVPQEARNHTLLAVLAAFKMQEFVAEQGLAWRMRIGIARGQALMGLMGSKNRKNYTATGAVVDLAGCLQELCAEGKVCVDEGVFAQVEPWFHARRLLLPGGDGSKAAEARLKTLICANQRAPTAVLVKGGRAIAAPAAKRRLAVYEIIRLKDPLEDASCVPAPVAAAYREMALKVSVPVEMLAPIEAMDGSFGHARVSAALAVALADAMGLEERQKRTVFLAAHLHDAAKGGLPERLFSHEHDWDGLDLADQELVKAHAREAGKALGKLGIPTSPEIIQAVEQHHECFDGSGYPGGLRGTQICLAARIIALADAYDDMTAWRPFSDPLPPEGALTRIKQEIHSGRFDPRVGEIFLKMMEC